MISTLAVRCLAFSLVAGCVNSVEGPGTDSINSDAETDANLDHSSGKGAQPSGSDSAVGYQPIVCQSVTNPACEGLVHELPVPSHFSSAIGGFSFMATDEADLVLPTGLPADYVMGGCYPVYRRGLFPTVDHYIADTYSSVSVPDAEATSWAQKLCSTTGVPVRHVYPPRPDGTEVGSGPLSRACITQVVHGIQAGDSQYTVFLPPDWDASAPAHTYPILFNGAYDLNSNVFRQDGAEFGRLVAKSGVAGGRGVIGVLWNGGGAYASRTMSPHAMELAAQIIATVASRYHGNPRWLVTVGGSRGGLTALAIAANTGAHPYRTVATVAMVPPTLLGEHMRLAGVTYPGLLLVMGTSTGLQDVWRASWTYPACAGHPELTGLTGWQANLKVLTGTSDPVVADTQYSLLGAASLDGLAASGAQVYLSIGEHDVIVPYAHQVQFGRTLVERGLTAQIEVLVRGGHAAVLTKLGGATTEYDLHAKVLDGIIATLSQPSLDLAGPVPTLVTKGIRFHRVDRVSGETEVFSPAAGYPFAVDLPYYAIAGQSFPAVVVGEPGTSYTLTLVYQPTGAVVGSLSAVIPSTMTETHWVDLPLDVPLGKYVWSARLVRADASIVDIPPAATPTGAPCTTELIGKEPSVDYSQATQSVRAPTLPAYATTNWGLSEY